MFTQQSLDIYIIGDGFVRNFCWDLNSEEIGCDIWFLFDVYRMIYTLQKTLVHSIIFQAAVANASIGSDIPTLLM